MEKRLISYQDETAVSLCPVCKTTYSPRWLTPKLSVYDTKGYSHLSLSGYISEKGDLYYEIRQGSFNGKSIVHFLEKGFTGRKRQKHTLIWDNASIHRCKEVKEFLAKEAEKQNRVWLEQLPPYSPELNPIELLFTYLKNNKLASIVCKTLTELRAYIIKAMEEIKENRELIKSFFRHENVGFMQC